MASSYLLILLFLFTTFHVSLSLQIPISKHPLSNQFLTQIRLGSEPVSLLLDLSSPSLWLVDSFSGTPIPSLSIPCSTAGDSSQPSPPSTTTCTVQSRNPIWKLSGRGELVSDSLSLPSQLALLKPVDDFLFVNAPKFLAHGLPDGIRGVFGLGRASRISPLSQLIHKFNLAGKFSLCLPGKTGKNGMILAGKSPERVSEIGKSMSYTPLLESGLGSSDEYYIRVKSVEISNKKLKGSCFRARLSTVDPLTRMGSGFYKTFLKAFEMAGDALNLTRVETRAPFGVCYAAGGSTGAVPVVDLVLQSEMVRWRINGRNSMVEVTDGVMCLGVVDGRSDLEEGEIVIGAHQLEDVLVEFDLRSGMLGFSSSLTEKGTSCAELSSDSAARSREF